MVLTIFNLFICCLGIYYLYSNILELKEKHKQEIERLEWRIKHLEDKLSPQVIGVITPANVSNYLAKEPNDASK